jgi:hypothetical protein
MAAQASKRLRLSICARDSSTGKDDGTVFIVSSFENQLATGDRRPGKDFHYFVVRHAHMVYYENNNEVGRFNPAIQEDHRRRA